MRSTRSRTKAVIKAEHNLASPIHKLPDELIAHVFVLGCPKPKFLADLSARNETAEDPFPYQVLVSSICRRWRRISLQSPTLWSFIFIMLPFKSLSMAKRYGPLMYAVSQRSGAARVTFTLKHRTPFCFRPDALWGSPAIHNLLATLLARVEFFDLHTLAPERTTSQHPVFPITRDRYPRLQHLSIMLGWNSFTPFLIPRGGSLDLDTFTCANWTRGPDPSSPFGQANPRHLVCASCDLDDITFAAIGHATRLKELDLHDCRWNTWQPYSSTVVKCLTIKNAVDQMSCPYALPPLGDLPLLAHLTIHCYNYASGQSLTEQSPDLWTTAASPPLSALKTLAIQEVVCQGKEHPSWQVSFKATQKLLTRAPNLIALEVWDTNALAALDHIRKSDSNGSLDDVRLRHLRLLRVGINIRSSVDLLEEIALGCKQLMGERSSLRVEWWIISHAEADLQLEAQPLLRYAPAYVERYRSQFPKNTPPSLRTVVDHPM